MNTWSYRINIIAPQDDTIALNAIWTIIAPQGNSEFDTFGVPLSANGQEPATHSGISTAATEYMKLHITETFKDDLSGIILSVQDYTENDWGEFLTENGLKVIEPETIDG